MEEINEVMQRKGLTRPCDRPWSSPVVLVKKKPVPGQLMSPDDLRNYRFCIDYRMINEQAIIWKAYPVSDMKQQLQKAAGFRYYSTLDIKMPFIVLLSGVLANLSQHLPYHRVYGVLPDCSLVCLSALKSGLGLQTQCYAQ